MSEMQPWHSVSERVIHEGDELDTLAEFMLLKDRRKANETRPGWHLAGWRLTSITFVTSPGILRLETKYEPRP